MRHCEFCATELLDHTTFCWHCGRAPTSSTEALTGVSISPAGNLPVEEVTTAPDLPIASLPVRTDFTEEIQEQNAVTAISVAENPTLPHAQPVLENQASTNADTDEEEEEEKRRRAAMFGPGLSLLGKVVTRAPGADVPVVQGTPQFKGVPAVQGAPHIAQAPHMPTIPKWQISRLPTYPSVPAVHQAAPAQPAAQPGTMSPPPQPVHPHSGPSGSGARQSGCVPGLVVAGVTCLLIIASIIGLGFTILSPSLSLGGSTNVAWGEPIHLHGSNFIPGSTVRLTLDGAAPLYYTSQNPATQVSYSTITTAGLDTIEEQFAQDSSAKNSVVVSGNGTFNLSVIVNHSWHAGRHFIRASEEISPRSAQLTFTIQQPGTSSTATPTPTGTPTPVTMGLSCVKPASIALTASKGYTQPVSQKVTLCAIGSGTINWTTSWDHNAAPWLQLDHTSGKINAPGQGQVKVSTLAASLKPGKYTTAITFSSQAGGTQVSLTVSFTVEAGCVSVTPGTFKVSGAVGNIQTQTATVTNCGNAAGSWFATTSASWLKVAPTSGTLIAGAAQKVTITMSQGKVGTLTGQSTFTLGESQFVVHVTLKVQAPTLSVNPSSLNAQSCSLDRKNMVWVCQATVTNDGNVHANLNWSTSSSEGPSISFSPANGTLAAGAHVQVKITIPDNGCPDFATLTFTGPANSFSVGWTYPCPSD
jgi:predicted secreted protein